MKNNYVIEGDVVKIFFRKKEGYFLIDKDDLEKFQAYTWYLNQNGYVESNSVSEGHIKAHHIAIGKPPKGLVTDHINRNRLDNRKLNLRHVTPLVNTHNRELPFKRTANNESLLGIRIYEGKKRTSYYVSIHDANNKTIHCGKFYDLQKALAARDIAYAKLKTGEYLIS